MNDSNIDRVIVVDPEKVDDVTSLDLDETSKTYFNEFLNSIKLDNSNTSNSETGSGSSGSGSGDVEDDDSEKRPDASNLTDYFYDYPIDRKFEEEYLTTRFKVETAFRQV